MAARLSRTSHNLCMTQQDFARRSRTSHDLVQLCTTQQDFARLSTASHDSVGNASFTRKQADVVGERITMALNTLLDLLNQDYVQRMYDNLRRGKYALQKYYENTDKVALVDEHGKFRVTTEKEEQGTIRHEIRMEPEGISLRRKTEIPGTTNIPWSLGQNNAVFQCLREITSIQPIELHGIVTVEDEKAIEVGRYRTQLMLMMALEHKRGKINVPAEGFFDCAGQDYGWERYSPSS